MRKGEERRIGYRVEEGKERRWERREKERGAEEMRECRAIVKERERKGEMEGSDRERRKKERGKERR